MGSIGKPRIVLEILGDQEKAAPHTSTRLTRTEEIRRERRHASSRARRGQPLFFLAAQVRKLSLSAFLEWAEEALKRHARDSDGDAAIEVLSFSSVFWVDPLVLVALGRSSWWGNSDCDRHDFF